VVGPFARLCTIAVSEKTYRQNPAQLGRRTATMRLLRLLPVVAVVGCGMPADQPPSKSKPADPSFTIEAKTDPMTGKPIPGRDQASDRRGAGTGAKP